MRAPVQGTNRQHPEARQAPLTPSRQDKEGTGLCWALPAVAQALAVTGAASLPGNCLVHITACVSQLEALHKRPLFSKMLIPARPFSREGWQCHQGCLVLPQQLQKQQLRGSLKIRFLGVSKSLHAKVPPFLPLPVDRFQGTQTPGRYKACQKGHSHQT